MSLDNPLPDLFKGMVFLFAGGVSEECRAKWSRYVIAYDGDVADSDSERVTHLVCTSEEAVRESAGRGSCSS